MKTFSESTNRAEVQVQTKYKPLSKKILEQQIKTDTIKP